MGKVLGYRSDGRMIKVEKYLNQLKGASKNKLKRLKRILDILSILENNAKISDRKLAGKLDTSQSTITRCRSMLEKKGIIEKYLTVINEENLVKLLMENGKKDL